MTSTTKKAFDLSRNSIYVADPTKDLCIIGGLALPYEQQGKLDTNVDASHVLYDERITLPLTDEFIANVDAYGVIEPIVIAKLDDKAVVVAGRQRVRAARVVNARRKARGEPPISVECKMRKDDLMGVMISENEARVSDDPTTKIQKFRRYMERGVSLEHAAKAFGVSPSTAKQWIAFDDNASTAVRDAVVSGKLSTSAAKEIARLKDPTEQDAALAAALAKPAKGTKRPSVIAARNAVKKTQAAKTGSTSSTSAGVTGKRDLKKLLDTIMSMPHPNASVQTLTYWEGVEDALKFVLGEDSDARITNAAEKAGVA